MGFIIAGIECPKCGETTMVLLDESRKSQSQQFNCCCGFNDRVHIAPGAKEQEQTNDIQDTSNSRHDDSAYS